MRDRSLIHDPTKDRLLQAAGEEFAEKGFEGATIRSISRRAGTNVAAVNYHYGDKEHLYEAAVREAHRSSMEASEEAIFGGGGEDATSHLHRFVREFLRSTMDRGRTATWHDALMLREMIQPTGASDSLVREMIRPRFEHLLRTLRTLCPTAGPERLHAIAFGLVGQCLHYKVGRPISVQLVGQEAYGRLGVDFVAEHITTMTLAAFGLAGPVCGPDGGDEPEGA